jgi:hypothetical protein
MHDFDAQPALVHLAPPCRFHRFFAIASPLPENNSQQVSGCRRRGTLASPCLFLPLLARALEKCCLHAPALQLTAIATIPPPHLPRLPPSTVTPSPPPHRLVVILSSYVAIAATTAALPCAPPSPPPPPLPPRAPSLSSFSSPQIARRQWRRRKRRKKRRMRMRRRIRAILLPHSNPKSNVARRMLIPSNPGGGTIKCNGATRRTRRDWCAVPHQHLPSPWRQQDQCPHLNFPHLLKSNLSQVSTPFSGKRRQDGGGGG